MRLEKYWGESRLLQLNVSVYYNFYLYIFLFEGMLLLPLLDGKKISSLKGFKMVNFVSEFLKYFSAKVVLKNNSIFIK